jgi:glycerophosphoryl diester phosphodiesterase family protein
MTVLVLAHTALHGSHRCASLDDIVRWASDAAPAHLCLVVDLKTRGAEIAAHRALSARGLLGRTTFTSQCRPILDSLRRADPEARVAVSLAGVVSRRLHGWVAWRREVVDALRAGRYDGLMLHRRLVDGAIVSEVHAAGATVDVWTVRDADEAMRLAGLGVDGVVTTDPQIVVRAVAGAPPRPPAGDQRRRIARAARPPAVTVAAAMPASAPARARLTDAGASGRRS